MKRLLLISIATFIISNGCKKEVVNQYVTTPSKLPDLVQKNTAPSSNAGWPDIGLLLPENSTTLSGSGADAENNITGYGWKKVSGPASFQLVNSSLPATVVKDLQKGTYEFELTVTDQGGLTAKDTVNVYVVDQPGPGPSELVVRNNRWGCPMGCYSLVTCIKCYVPAEVPFTVYLKKQGTSDWIQVFPELPPLEMNKYYYTIYNGNLEIHSFYDETFTIIDVKIKY